MSKSLPKNFEAAKYEPKIYRSWTKHGVFRGRVNKRKKPFVITLPPPNVTGNLHAGHAMYVTEDIMVRYQKMLGVPYLWLPGFDHASIAVEYLVTKQLKKEGKTKQEIGRKGFLKRAHQFALDSKRNIKHQLQKLGFLLDWSREAYTMDKIRSKAVAEAFKRLYQKGLIYRGEYIVNWCPDCQTAISDLENEHIEQEGKLYYLKYGPFVIATTRPETKFGDTAVAVHPKDVRYQQWIGREFVYESLIGPKKMKVIADAAVDPEFGTGVVKVTPAHDPTDFEIGQRHNLEIVKVINERGRLTEAAGRFANLSVLEAREKVVEELKARGEIVKIETIKHSVGHCQRCGSITEPLISRQWFVKTKLLANQAIAAVQNGEITIIPKRFEKIYFHWLRNIKDWCISRQLWWGHQLPVYFCKNKTGNLSSEKFIVSLKPPRQCPFCKSCKMEQSTDILDTWFSSSLWPISVFGWPEKTSDFRYFYPTTVRETGYDILFFWVAREIMMCMEMTGKIPFRIVYLHGLVRDEKGRKFSKTAGIGFDPLEMTQKYGTDALRMALIYGNAAGADVKISEEKIKAMRNFTNKIWNAGRFVLSYPPSGKIKKAAARKHKDDLWILKELEKTVRKTNEFMKTYRFGQAAEILYQFFWHVFCDKYIELAKSRRDEAQPTLLTVLTTSLKLLHPFMPFVTEAIWLHLPLKKKTLLISEKWPLLS